MVVSFIGGGNRGVPRENHRPTAVTDCIDRHNLFNVTCLYIYTITKLFGRIDFSSKGEGDEESILNKTYQQWYVY